MGRKSEICRSEAAFRRKTCVTLVWKGSVPSLLIYTVLIWEPCVTQQICCFSLLSQLWVRFESGVLLDVDTIASLSSFLQLLLFQCMNWTISRSVRIWKSGDRICILSLPCRMVKIQHFTYHQVGVSLPSLHRRVKLIFSVLQFKTVNSKNLAILLKS